MRQVVRSLIGVMLLLPQMAMAADVYLTQVEDNPVTKSRLPEMPEDDAVTLSANEMGVDEKTRVVIALGNVEVMRGDMILMADQITYYQDKDLVIAQGNVSMLQPNGDVFFADKAELKEGMKHAVINKFKARLSDNSILVANSAVKVNSSVTALKKASYTPCNLCANAAPFWQMNADNAVVNDIDETVTYRNAFLEMSGVPVLYTPYLSHPTPDARAKSGLLTPSYSSNIYFGAVAKVPYYWRIDEDKDVVITPWLTTSEGPLLQWDYNQLRDKGNYNFQGSITNPRKIDDNGNRVDGNELRGHIFARGVETVGDDSRIGFDIQRTTDDTYLRRYGFGGQEALFSNAYYEYASGRNLGVVSALAIQGLRDADESKTTPLLLPIFQGYYETTPYDSGLKLNVAGDAQMLTRETGVRQRRISVTPGATLPMVTDGGQILTATLQVRQDLYSTDDIVINGQMGDEMTTRTLPTAALEWRYPMINTTERGAWVMEPIALGILRSNGGNPDTISNEDSRLLELSDTNLFSLERMPGLDLYDAGSRVSYGVRSQFYDVSGITFDGLLGQNYSVNRDTPFPNSTRAGEQFSDYIGRVAANYAPVTVSYRFALDKEDATLNRNEIGFGFARPYLNFYTSYRSIKNNRYLPDSREVQASMSMPLSDAWSIYGSGQRDLELSEMVSANGGIVYKNECFTIMFDTLRSYARDRDILPSTEFTFRVGFKNLGEFGGR